MSDQLPSSLNVSNQGPIQEGSASASLGTSIQNEQKEPTLKQKIIYELKSISIIIFAVFLFRSVFFEPFKIPTGSMIPTLLIGDFILVNKMSYGFKVPFSDWISDPIYITTPQDPKRGDVVVFKYPQDTSINYIKRVVGIAGDTVEIKDKVVYVNGKPIEIQNIESKKYMDDMDEKYQQYRLKFFQANVENKKYVYQVDDDNFYKTDFDKITVPKGHFFVMGDNRDFSYDSRYWGMVPHKYLKGKAILVWFSMIFPFGEYKSKFRYWRIGQRIE
jgi:signal peptidase I